MEQKNIKKNNFSETSFFAIYNAVSKDSLKNRTLSGGDRIMIELSKIWKHTFKTYEMLTCTSGVNVIKTYFGNTGDVKLRRLKTPASFYDNILILYLYKTIKGVLFILSDFKPKNKTLVFSSSDFLPDVIPAWYAKRKNKNVKWIAAFYFFASSPFSKHFPYKGFHQRFRGTMYYYTQKIAYYLIRKHADFVILCNEVDRKIFIKDGYNPKKIYPIYGGVDLNEAYSVKGPPNPLYDAIFMARFHPQKGPLECAMAWNEVVKKLPEAKLAMIGNGPLENSVKEYIVDNNLQKNIKLYGFVDGNEKYKILKSAKIFIHSAVYETGGMAAAEGMAAGLPVIAFDHEGFDYCYPKGMIRVAPVGNINKLASAVLNLLKNQKKYSAVKSDAVEFVKEWDWKKRAEFLLDKMKLL